jgi:hypothetical protein
MMTVTVCAFVGSLLSVASPTTSYRHQAAVAQSAPPAQVVRMTRQGALNGRGQVWRPADTGIGSATAMDRRLTVAHSFSIAGR